MVQALADRSAVDEEPRLVPAVELDFESNGAFADDDYFRYLPEVDPR